jgi:polyisoprenoid-binding protein YceI
MKKMFYPFAALVILATSAYAVINAQDWKIKDGYTVKFTSKDPSGVFSGLKGTIQFDDKDLAASKFDVSIDVATINTGNGMQNQHAKSEKWFDAAKYPTINFKSEKISRTSSGYKADGTLEVHGVKKQISMPFIFQKNATGGLFTSTFDVNRVDFNIGKPGGKVPDVIKIDLSVPVSN